MNAAVAVGIRVPGPELPGLLPAHLAGRAAPDSVARPRRTPRDWLVDVTAFLLAVGFGAEPAWRMLTGADPVSPVLLVADLTAGVAACAALWTRRRWPVGLALALLPVVAFSATAGMASLIVLFTVAVHRRYPIALTVAAAHVGTLPAYFALRPEPDLPYSTAVVLFTAVLAATVAWGMFVRARRQLVLSLRDRAERAEAEQQLRVEQARHLERTRIAREMHDVLAHRISLLSLHAGALEFCPDAAPAELARAAGVVRASAHQALADLREVIGVLREEPAAEVPRPQPTLADLPALVAEARRAGARIDLVDRLDRRADPPANVGRSAYRVVQEALTNARKHAPGARVELTVAGGPGDGLTLEVANPWPVAGPAGSPIPGTGTGLIGLAERVHLAGGRFGSGHTDGGFRVAAWLPWPR